ncbi:MAG: His/Gly/Thr/Pro-type tRNA ligase C-terminal domain-containing protein, partial [Candidatus Marinimicrobia bacterium]|nr:His/Gly/Thr/Pro-type tRNA ligase C-terminal domain-containing protein [Candidatus Neomarinimicrobiota bacterium]
VMKLHPKLAPVKAVVCPLTKKDGLPELARKITDDLKTHYKVIYDQQGSIGKRYYRQDEAGTPFGITVDHQSLEDNTVTLRHRDTQKQDRVNIDALVEKIDINILNYS